MGKKGSLFSAIKGVFTPHSKEKLVNVSWLLSTNVGFKEFFDGACLLDDEITLAPGGQFFGNRKQRERVAKKRGRKALGN